MAQDVSNIFATIIAQEALSILKSKIVMPNAVHRDYSAELASHGDTISIPVPGSFVANDYDRTVTVQEAAFTKESITLDKHKHVAFDLTSKEMALPRQDLRNVLIEPAVQAIVEQVDSDLHALHKDILTVEGAVGTNMVVSDITNSRKLLNKAKAMTSNRSYVLSNDDAANLLTKDQFINAAATGQQQNSGLIEGDLGRRFGFNFYETQNTSSITAADTTAAVDKTGGYAIGATDIAMDDYSGDAPTEGQLVTFAGSGHSQIYTVDAGSTTTLLKLKGPRVEGVLQTGLVSAVADDEVITFLEPDNVNLAFQKNAIALVTRPLNNFPDGMGAVSATIAQDGLALRVWMKVTDNGLLRTYVDFLPTYFWSNKIENL
jgi:hypothetical protein